MGLHDNQRQFFLLLPMVYGAGGGQQQVALMSLMRRHITIKAPMIAGFERNQRHHFENSNFIFDLISIRSS